MIYLSGCTADSYERQLLDAGIGLLVQPRSGYAVERLQRFHAWGADNGCFANTWDEDRWLRWLDRLPRDRCLFAVAPDVYPDAAATLKRSAAYFDLIREMGFPVALVAQDGAERLDLPWDDFDCLFVGGAAGPREWKTSSAAEALCHEARNHGKWVHMGRVNSLRRMERARAMGCNSADGTFIKYERRTRAGEDPGARDGRGAATIDGWVTFLASNPLLPTFSRWEAPSLPIHRELA